MLRPATDRREEQRIRVNPSFGIWQRGRAVSQLVVARRGTVVRRTWWFTISCLTFACVPKGPTVQVFRLPPATVEAKTRDGALVNVSRAWPVLNVAGRFLPPALPNVRPALRIETGVPSPTYRVNPTVLANALDGLGALAVAIGLVLAAVAGARTWTARHPVSVDNRPPLVRALALVRQAQGRKPDDRRRAAGLLARMLPEQGNGLTALAAEVAWSKAEPSPTRLEELARTVEAELKEKS